MEKHQLIGECDLCKKLTILDEEYDVVHGVGACKGCLDKLKAVEKISPVFLTLLCEKIIENNDLMM